MWQRGVDLILGEFGAVLALQDNGPKGFTLKLFNGIGTQNLPTVSLSAPGQETLVSTVQNISGGIAEFLVYLSRKAEHGYDFSNTAAGIRALDTLMWELAKIGAAMSASCKKVGVGRFEGPTFAIEISPAESQARLAYFDVEGRYCNTDVAGAVEFKSEGESMVAAIEAIVAQARDHLEANRRPPSWQRLLQHLSRRV